MSAELKRPFTLTLEAAKAACRKAYRNGKLTAQHPDPLQRECIYDAGGGFHCAIGCALPQRVLNEIKRKHLNMFKGVGVLAEKGVIKLRSRLGLRLLQARHDSWAGASILDRAAAEARFIKLIQVKRRKVAHGTA